MKYLLDSNVFIHLANRSAGAQQIEQRIIDASMAQCLINAVIAAELRYKLETGPGRVRKTAIELLTTLLATVQCVDLSCAAGHEAGQIRAELHRAGTPIGLPDALIAGHARASGLILVSDNSREFARVPDLQYENWRVQQAPK